MHFHFLKYSYTMKSSIYLMWKGILINSIVKKQPKIMRLILGEPAKNY